MAKLKKNWVIWYIGYLLTVIAISFCIYALPIPRVDNANLTILTLATTATFAIALASTNYHEYLSVRGLSALRWGFNTHAFAQLQYFIVTVYATLLATTAAQEFIGGVYFLVILNVVLNISIWVMLFGALYWIIRAVDANNSRT